jgi:hypothetical protein
MTPSESPATRRLSTADFATTGERSEEVSSDEATMSRVQSGVEQDERHPGAHHGSDGVDYKHAPLFDASESERFRGRWTDIQAGFVDQPRHAVEQADSLVAEMMQRLAQVFADERSRLGRKWDRAGEADTEALRLALRRYRSFFDRLLTM